MVARSKITSRRFACKIRRLGTPRCLSIEAFKMSFPDPTRLTALTFDCYGTLSGGAVLRTGFRSVAIQSKPGCRALPRACRHARSAPRLPLEVCFRRRSAGAINRVTVGSSPPCVQDLHGNAYGKNLWQLSELPSDEDLSAFRCKSRREMPIRLAFKQQHVKSGVSHPNPISPRRRGRDRRSFLSLHRRKRLDLLSVSKVS